MNSLALFGLTASVAFLIYTYLGYPAILYVLARLWGRASRKGFCQPQVSVVLAVHNEERNIQAKLENLLHLDYPAHLIEILVVSDASTDATNRLVAACHSPQVSLIEVSPRQGKHYAQKCGIEAAHGEIIVFTDAAALLEPDALTEMVRNYLDPEVGSVSSRDRVRQQEGELSRENTFIDYDMTLRLWESRLSSVTGLSGSFFSARQELCKEWWLDRSSDFQMALESVRHGYRAVLDPSSIHSYTATQSLAKEYRRKTRTILNGLVVFRTALPMLNVFRYGLYSWQLFSHKLCRWLSPFALASALGGTVILALGSWPFRGLLALEVIFILMAVLGSLETARLRHSSFRSAAFFMIANLAAVKAWIDLCRGRSHTVWDPTRRP